MKTIFYLMPRRKFAVPSVPPMNLLIHKNMKNAINFGIQSIGHAPRVAVPPVKFSSEKLVELMH